MAIKQHCGLMVAIALLTSCVVGPNYHRPAALVTPQFKEAKGKTVIGKMDKRLKIAEPRDDRDRGAWWKIFRDKTLNKLEAELNSGNQSIAQAYANYKQARAMVDEARAAFYPTLSLTSNVTRQLTSGGSALFNNNNGSTTTNSTQTTTGQSSNITAGVTSNSTSFVTKAIEYTSYYTFLGGSWQPDIWGLVRRTVQASAAGAEASAALFANTRLSMQGTLAQTYFELRALDMDQKILDESVQGYAKTLQLTRNQYASGVASSADVLQAKSQLEVAQAAAINNGVNRAIYEHAVAVLIGRAPASFSLPPMPLTQTPPPIPVLIPSALLERRPDIAQAERLMGQANEQIGVAIAAYFPNLNFSGNVNNFGISGLSLLPVGWAVGAQVYQLIYDGGLRSATVRASRAAYKSAVASYRQVVLAAFQNVEDNLSNLRILRKEGIVQNQAVATSKKSLRFVINQYKAGVVDYASVITAQITLYTAQKTAADIVGLQMTSAVALIIALGGGWDAHCIDCAAGPPPEGFPL